MKKLTKSFAALLFCLVLMVSSASIAFAANNMANVKIKTVVTYNSITLSWGKISGATGYQIQEYKNKKWVDVKGVKAKYNKTSYTFSKLKYGTTYKYRVRAYKARTLTTDYSKAYTQVSAKTAVAKVSGLKATNYSGNIIKLSWTKASGVTGYQVYRSIDGKKWTKLATTKNNYYNAQKLTPGKTYQFKVRAYKTASKSKTYYGSYSSVVKMKAAVPAVTNLVVKSNAYNTANLTWSKVPYATGYQVYRSTDGKKWTKLATTTKTAYTASKLTVGTKYYFKVRACHKIGDKTYYGAYSSSKNVTPALGTVNTLTLKGILNNTVSLSWAKVSGATGYNVHYSTDGKTWNKVNSSETSATLNLSYAVSYQIKVRAYAKNGSKYTYGGYSNVISAVTAPAAVTGLTATASGDSISVAWSSSANVNGYELSYKINDDWTVITKTGETSYKLSDLDIGVTYEFRVRAYNKNDSAEQYGAYSAIVSATTEGVKNNGALEGSEGFIKLAWTPINGAVSYKVERHSILDTAWVSVGTISADEYSGEYVCEFNPYNVNVGIAYKVSGLDADGNVIETHKPVTVCKEGYSAKTDNYSVDMSWPAVDDAKYYVICKIIQSNVPNYAVLEVVEKNRIENFYLEPGITDITVFATSQEPLNKISSTAPQGTLARFSLPIVLPELEIVTDKNAENYNESINSQLLYLVGAINRTKYSRNVAVHAKSEAKYRVDTMSMPIYGDMDFTDGKDSLMEKQFKKDFADDADVVEALGNYVSDTTDQTYNFGSAGTAVVNNHTIRLYEFVEPADSDLAYLYNSNTPDAWKNGFDSVTATKQGDSIKLVLKFKQEKYGTKTSQPVAYYHPGFMTTLSGMDGLMDGDFKTELATIGASTITAVINKDGTLDSYEATSPFTINMGADFVLTDGVSLKMAMGLSGNTYINYTFTR